MTAASTTVGAEDSDDKVTPALLKLAGVIVLGTFAVQMDATMVNVALDTLTRKFDVTVSTIQWISTAYLLSLSMMIPLTGWLVDRFGARPAWMFSIAAFLGGSVLCGLAWSVESLIAFRVVQGIGGGILLPLSQAILAQSAGPKRLGRLMAAVGIPALLGPVIGPVVGGVIVDQLSWQWIFFINVPICLAALLFSWKIMPRTAPSGASKLDVLGLALLSPALAGIVYGLSQAGSSGSFTDRRVVLPVIGSVILLLAFAFHALRTKNVPVIDLRLLKIRNFVASAGTVFFVTVSLLGAMLLLPLYYQQVRGESAMQAGLLLAPQGLGIAVAIVVSGKLADRISPRPIVLVGVLLSVLGTLAYTQVGDDTSKLLLSGALVLTGAGFGAVLVPATAAAYRGLRNEAIPRATSGVRIFQQVGGSFGVAVLAVALQRNIADALNTGRPTPAKLAEAFGDTFWWAAGVTALALLPALFLGGFPRDQVGADEEESSQVTPEVGAAVD